MTRNSGWQTWLSWLALVVAVFLLLRADIAQVRWVAQLSREGSPPPAFDPHSATGYVDGQRHFLGFRERGETYRGIAAAQEMIAAGPASATAYRGDNVPLGRPQLLPRLHVAWVAAVAWSIHLVTAEPLARCVERAALWEPVVTHVLAFVAAAIFMGRRYGLPGAAAAGIFFALFPPLAGQFLPGVLTARTWAFLLSAYAVARQLPPLPGRKDDALSGGSAVAAGLALWLDPAFGFPAVLICALAGIGWLRSGKTSLPTLRWSLIGAGLTVAAWSVDRSPWSVAAGELRYVHPLYALAWLGLGLGLDGWQRGRAGAGRRRVRVEIAAAVALAAPLVYVQLRNGYKAWLYTGASMRRLTSLDETVLFDTAIDWLARVPFADVAFVGAPLVGAIATLAVLFFRRRQPDAAPPSSLIVPAIVLVATVAFACFRVRWLVFAALVALPSIWSLAPAASPTLRRSLLGAFAVFCLGLVGWGHALASSSLRPSGTMAPAAVDLQALIYRHFSHWIASHHPAQATAALAPPELSDSIVFHGGGRVLMSTAWESYPGQVAASRILSAPEGTEAEAVLQSRELTHLVLPSWDRVLPLLVREPEQEGKESFHARLQRWVLPPYLRAMPYHLPRLPGFLDQQLAVFQVVFPQDDALSLSRLAEYFVEMNRPEPAGLAAQVLADSFPDDPNAAIARALVYAQAKQGNAFEREAARLADDVAAGRTPTIWDRRVQRAIVLALARRHEAARPEIAACLAEATADALYELTPLQAYRLHTLAGSYGLSFPEPALAQRTTALGAEYLQEGK